MRVGLVGTGHWARTVHGEALATSSGVELRGVFGRDETKTAALARDLGTAPFADFDALLDAVDAISFAVPPDVQVPLARRAAEAGKHLLLEKPIATSSEDAASLVAAVEAAGVASIVFFTARFSPPIEQWLRGVESQTWEGGAGEWISAALSAPESPYRDSAWRADRGALWDTGPHALSLLLAALGPIDGVQAVAGARDLVHLVFHHVSDATSTASLTLTAPPAAAHIALSLWGPAGVSAMPERGVSAGAAYANALSALAVAAESETPRHPCDVRFGAAVVDILEAAAAAIASA